METTLTSKNLAHLGLVASMIDELGIVDVIDSGIIQDTCNRPLTAGEAVKAMIISGYCI